MQSEELRLELKYRGSDLLPLQAKQEALIEKHQRRQRVQIREMEFMEILPFGQPQCLVALMNCAAQNLGRWKDQAANWGCRLVWLCLRAHG